MPSGVGTGDSDYPKGEPAGSWLPPGFGDGEAPKSGPDECSETAVTASPTANAAMTPVTANEGVTGGGEAAADVTNPGGDGWKLGDYDGSPGEGDDVNVVLKDNKLEWEFVRESSNVIVVKGQVFWVLKRDLGGRPLCTRTHPPQDFRESDIKKELCAVKAALLRQPRLFTLFNFNPKKVGEYLARFPPRVQVLATWIRGVNLGCLAKYFHLLLETVATAKRCSKREVATKLLEQWWVDYIMEAKERRTREREEAAKVEVENKMERMTIERAVDTPLPDHLSHFD